MKPTLRGSLIALVAAFVLAQGGLWAAHSHADAAQPGGLTHACGVCEIHSGSDAVPVFASLVLFAPRATPCVGEPASHSTPAPRLTGEAPRAPPGPISH